jgi:hypothetical protein
MNAKEELTKLLMESYDQGVKDGLETSLQLIKERLAQPEQEPTAKYSDIVSDGGLDPRNKFDAPPQRTWVDLTAEEVLQCWERAHEPGNKEHINAIRMADEVEAKLKEKNA